MNLIKIVFISLIFISCNASKSSKDIANNKKTYAEISVKTGGKWQGKKYEGGNFVNVSELTLPENHTDHSYYIRYEGPGWESNKIGYRLYLDWRNAIDIFGKKTEDIILPKVGQDGFDSYHLMADWGADILKVGKGLGIGSIGRYVNREVLHFNDVKKTTTKIKNDTNLSSIQIFYEKWQTNNQITDLKSELIIFPDQRYTKHTIETSENLEGICTGIVNLYNLPMVKKTSSNKKWAYIATYGLQTLFDDNLGMAIFYETDKVEQVFTGKHDHLIQFKPTKKPNSFYFLGAWEKEPQGIQNKVEFFNYLDDLLEKLNKNNQLN